MADGRAPFTPWEELPKPIREKVMTELLGRMAEVYAQHTPLSATARATALSGEEPGGDWGMSPSLQSHTSHLLAGYWAAIRALDELAGEVGTED